MLKRCTLLLLVCILLAGWTCHAWAIGNQDIYTSAQNELIRYFNGENNKTLDALCADFESLGRYQESASFKYYASVLRDVEAGDFTRLDMLLRLLRSNTDFCAMLKEHASLPSVDELEAYARGRKAEAEGLIDEAILYYLQSNAMLDSMDRAEQLMMSAPAATAVPTPEPTAVPTPVPTEVPTPVPTAVPTQVPTQVPTAVPTRVPTQVPTAVPTATPAPAALLSLRGMAPNEAGMLVVEASCSQHSPVILYRQATQPTYALEQLTDRSITCADFPDTTGGTLFTLESTVPGTPYWIVLHDGVCADQVYLHTPEEPRGFSDFYTSLNIQPRIHTGKNKYTNCHEFTLSDTADKPIGFQFSLDHTYSGNERAYHLLLTLTTPDGLVNTLFYSNDVRIGRTLPAVFADFVALNGNYDALADKQKNITPGAYTVTAYLNGMKAGSDIFEVRQDAPAGKPDASSGGSVNLDGMKGIKGQPWSQNGTAMTAEFRAALRPGSVIEVSYTSEDGFIWLVFPDAQIGWTRVGMMSATTLNAQKNLCRIPYQMLVNALGEDPDTWGERLQCEGSSKWQIHSVRVVPAD